MFRLSLEQYQRVRVQAFTGVHIVQGDKCRMLLRIHDGLPVLHPENVELDVAQRGVVRGSLSEKFQDQSSGPLAVLTSRVLSAAQYAGDNLYLHLPVSICEFVV
jgi:hypothetical protein